MNGKPGSLAGPLLVLTSISTGQLGVSLSVPLMASQGAFGTTALRLFMAALVSTLIARPDFRSFGRAQWQSAIALGTAMAVTVMSYFAATNRIPVGAATTIDFLGPLSVAVWSLKGLPRIALPLLAASGVIAMSYSAEGTLLFDPVGVMLALVAACGWATYIVLTKRVGDLFSEQDGLSVALIVAAGLSFPMLVLVEPPPSSWGQFPIILGLALLSPLIPLALEMLALRRMELGTFSILMSLEPAFGALLGYAILDQHLSARQMIGILAVMAASIGAVLLTSGTGTRAENRA